MSRSKVLDKKMREKTRKQILSSSLNLFAKKGLAATKIRDISSAAGISQGLFYHYFNSKEEIFNELIKDAFEKLNAACFYLEKLPLSPKEKIEKAIKELVENLEKSKDAAQTHLLITQASVSESTPEETKKIIRNKNTTPYQVITRIMINGQKNGTIKNEDPQELALLFWSSINGLAINKAVHGENFKAPNSEIIASMFIQ